MKLKKFLVGLIVLIIGFSAIILITNIPIEEDEEETKAYLYDVFHRCDSITDWTTFQCTLSLSSTQKVEGKYSIKMTAGDGLLSYMTYARTVNWSEFGNIIFSVYHLGYTNEIGKISLRTDAGNWSTWNFDFAGVWTERSIDLSSAPDDSLGTLDLANITEIQVTQWNMDTPGEDFYFDFFHGKTIDITSDITYCKVVEEMGMPSFAELKIKGASLDHFQAGLELDIHDKDDVLSWNGRVLYPEAVLEGTKVVGKLKVIGLNSQFNNSYRKNYTTARDSDYVIKDIIDNGLLRFSYDDEIDDFATTYKYDLKTKIQKMFNYLMMLERAVIGYLPDGETFFNKYDNLSKGPQIYQGTYNFEEEAVGTTDSDITFVTAVSGDDSGKEASIVASNDGHKKVLKFVSNGDNGTTGYYSHLMNEVSGTIELWMKYIDHGQGRHNIYLYEGASAKIPMYFNSVDNLFKVQYGDGLGGSTIVTIGAVADTWHHVRIYFDCGTDKFSIWFNGDLFVDDENFYADRTATSLTSHTTIHTIGGGVNSLECYIDAVGNSWDANYDVGDNLKCWDESTSKIKITSYTPSANRHVTRTPVIGGVNSLGQVYYVGKASDSAVQKYGLNQLQPWRDSEITNYTEAKQIGDNLQIIYSIDTQMIAMIVVGKGHLQVTKTLNMGWAGVFTITQKDFLLTKRIWYPMNDICEIELTDNVLTRKAFNVRVINNFYDEDAQKTIDIAEVPESTEDGVVVEGARHDRFVWRVPEPTDYDFDETALVAIGDVAGTWYDLDLSSIVPVGTTSVEIRLEALDNLAGSLFMLRKKGQEHEFQVGCIQSSVGNKPECDQIKIGVGVDRTIQFAADPKASDWTSIGLLIMGWYI